MNNSMVKYRQSIFQKIGNFISKIFNKEKINNKIYTYKSEISAESQKNIDMVSNLEKNFDKIYELSSDELINIINAYDDAIQALTLELVKLKSING